MNIRDSFGHILNVSAKNIKRELDDKLKKYNITTTQWAVIKLLSEKDDLTQAEIAEMLSSDRATAGTVIDKLISKKLVYKNQSEIDRRAYRVKISQEGLELAEKVNNEAVRCNNKALTGFSDEEVKKFIAYLKKVNDNLKEG